MAPEMGSIQTTHERQPVQFITVNLLDGKKFDVEAFDKQAAEVCGFGSKIYAMKYCVIGDVIYAFRTDDHNLSHLEVHDCLRSLGIQGKLQSAGAISRKTNFETKQLIRTIDDWSMTLSSEGLLSSFDSNKYKTTTIKESLGEHFDIK